MEEQLQNTSGESHFEKNLAALAALNPEQAKTIETLAPKVENRLYPVHPLQNGYVNLTIPSSSTRGYTLFTKDNPKEEIQSWINETDLDKESIHAVILIGFGLGYYPKAVLDKLPETGVLAVVEPDPIHFFTAFREVDLSNLLADKRLHLYVGQKPDKSVESVGKELQWGRFISLSYRLLVTPLMRRLQEDYISKFTTLWRDSLQRELMYRRSRIDHSSTVVLNTIANAGSIIQYPGINLLFHHFKNLPAVLVAAGPSLEKNLDILRENQGNFIIACMNTAYPVLRRNGIHPHIVFTMDHQERNVLSFDDDVPSPETYLVGDPRIDPRILHHFHPRVFLASWRTTTETLGEPAPVENIPVPRMSGNAVYLWLQSHAGSKGDVFGPGSGAVVGFHILARMGCQPIILVGQDLAFTEDKRYASGTIFEDKNLPRDEAGAHQVPSVDGGSLETSETLHLYRKLLEHEIARFKIPVYNTSSGALILGTITSRLQTLLPDLKISKTKISSFIESIHSSFQPKMDKIDLQRILEKAIKKLEAFSDEAKNALSQLPPDTLSSLSVEQKRQLVKQLEEAVARCSNKHLEAFELLNELLQESHFKYEECRWRFLIQTDQNQILNDKLQSQVMILDEFVKQADTLSTLFEEKIIDLDK